MSSYLKSEGRYRMPLQTDQEFDQKEIKKLNFKHNVEHYNSKLNKAHVVAVEQKIRELENRLKILDDQTKLRKRPSHQTMYYKKLQQT